MSPPITENVETLLSACGFVAAATVVAWVLGFFRLPSKSPANQITFLPAIGAFALYFAVQLVLVPAVVLTFFYLTQTPVPDDLGKILSVTDVGWISLTSIVLSTAAVTLYSLTLGSSISASVWNGGSGSLMHKLKSVIIGVLSWLFVYPWVIVVAQIITIIFIWHTKEMPPIIDQEMVRHLKEISSNKPLFYGTIGSVILLVPIAEEILFRGFLQNFFKRHLGIAASIFLTSALFASLHYSIGQGFSNWQIVLSLFLVSLFLGYVYERQQTLWGPIALHVAINGISIAILFL